MTQIDGYQLLDRIGEGGMATVYRGIQLSLNRPVAIKILAHNVAARQEILRRFDKESLIIARLNHPHIIHVIDRGVTAKGMPYFVMEYVEGMDLAAAIRAGTLNLNRKLEIVMQICKALSYAHNNGVVHRDIKPANVLIDCEGTVRMLDFGIAQFYDDACGDADKTRPGVIMGTIPYMSPEQLSGSDSVTPRSDLYSLGVLMYELFTGIKPVGNFKPPSQIEQSLPRQIEDVILSCMDPDPLQRPASADEIKDCLLKLLQGAHLATAQRQRARQGITSIEEKFALLDVIKEERCGSVYLYEDRVGQSLLVIKKRPSTSAGYTEAKLLTALKHKNIVNILGASKNNAVFIIVMEYLSGGSLTDRLVKTFGLQEFLPVARQICEGVAFAHRNRIVHGNLRPSNILFAEDGQAKIADFGIDEHYAGSSGAANWYGVSAEPKSIRADIYAAGVIFHQMLTGLLPPAATGARGVLDPSAKNLPPEVQSLLVKMLVRKPDARYASFDQIRADLEAISAIYAPPFQHTMLEPTQLLEDTYRRSIRQAPLPMWAVIGILILAIVLSAAAALYFSGDLGGAGFFK